MGKESTFDGIGESEADFKWFDEEMVTTTSPEEVLETIEKDAVVLENEEEVTKIDEKEKALTDDIFKDFENDTQDEAEAEFEDEGLEAKPTPGTKVVGSKIASLELLKEKGLVDYELEDGQVLTEELAEELAEQGWEAAIENEVNAYVKELPDAAKNLLKIATKGGDVNAYLTSLVQRAATGITKDTDMTVEANQVLALTLDLKNQDYDDEYIETHIQGLKDAGKLEAMSEKVVAKIVKKQEQDDANALQSIENSKIARKEGIKKQKIEITEHLATLDNVKGVVLNKKDKEELPDYISVPAVELNDGRVITEMQADLFKAMADKSKLTLLAKLLKNDFDFSSVTNATITKYSRDIEANVTNSAKGKNKDIKSSGSSHKAKKSLADMLD